MSLRMEVPAPFSGRLLFFNGDAMRFAHLLLASSGRRECDGREDKKSQSDGTAHKILLRNERGPLPGVCRGEANKLSDRMAVPQLDPELHGAAKAIPRQWERL